MNKRIAYARGWLAAKRGKHSKSNPYNEPAEWRSSNSPALYNSNFFQNSPTSWESWEMGFGRVIWKKINKGYADD